MSPYQVHLVLLVKDTEISEQIYNDLTNVGIEVFYDDRKESAGVKLADADLIGLPIRITIANRGLKEGKLEVKIRETGEILSFELNDIVNKTKETISNLTNIISNNIVETELN